MKKEDRKSRLRNILAIIFLFEVSYLSLNIYSTAIDQILGVSFLASGLYGCISLYNGKKFVF